MTQQSFRSPQRPPNSHLQAWWMIILGVVAVGVFGGLRFVLKEAPSTPPSQPSRATFPHIHGLGWTGDGSQLIVAAHDGLRVFTENRWIVPKLPKHDFMGYAATDTGFYSSGHPDPTISALGNPLGLVMSVDGGQTLTPLRFMGEYDFHTMGVGYYSHAIYVFTPQPSAALPAGINYSLDNATTWTSSQFPELGREPYQIAVHPTDPAVVVVATVNGAYLSSDFGATTTLISEPEPITAVAFHPDGSSILFGSTTLLEYDYVNQVTNPITTPLSGDDVLAAIAVNPSIPTEIALATHQRTIYRSSDGGQTWMPIAVEGIGIDQP